MGRLTEDMSRLRDEINSMRGTRQRFMRNLRDEINSMRGTRQRFMRNLRDDVRQMLSNFRRKRTKECKDFLSRVQNAVAKMRHEFISDILGAHFAFAGTAPAESASPEKSKRKKR